MKEQLLQFIWQFGKYNSKNMKTTSGEEIFVIHPGTLNHHAGPDFSQARIKIGDTEWAGNVEIHVKASDWYAHTHQNDPLYESVILHVVFEQDIDNFPRPTLELKDRVSNSLLSRYSQLMQNQQFVPCESFLPSIDDFTWLTWKERLLTERLEDKTSRICQSLERSKNNWQQAFYEQLAYNFGLKTNELAFEELAKRIPLKTIAKHKQNQFQIEALLFGTAGLLESPADEYAQKLRDEFDFLQHKYNSKPMRAVNWNFGRVRPPSLPTVRIAQFAALLSQSSALFSKIVEKQSLQTIESYFEIQPSEYWKTHYVFGKESETKEKHIGKSKIQNLIINTVVPFQFIYGKQQNKPDLVKQSTEFLLALPAEKNGIINQWKQHVKIDSAYDSQALLHLHKHYCRPKKCLNCRIGHTIFTKN